MKRVTIKSLGVSEKNLFSTLHSIRFSIRHRLSALAMAVMIVVAMCGTSHAYLGGFEDPDGYKPFFNEVVNYNAGAYGANAGGGAYTTITPNTGLWQKLQGPLSPATGSSGYLAYATGHQNYDRTNPGTSDQGLVITTNSDGWTAGTQEYSYSLDSFDLGGMVPTTRHFGIEKETKSVITL